MLIYLASPYSDPDPHVRDQRARLVSEVTVSLMREGVFVYSPIAYCHNMAVEGDLPTEFEYWQEFDRLMINKCDKLVVLMIPGWDRSKGIAAELEIAIELGKGVEYMDDMMRLTPWFELAPA